MPYIAARRLKWGDGYIEVGSPIPEGQRGRNLPRMEARGDILRVEDTAWAESVVVEQEESSPTPEVYDVEIPDDWEDLSWPEMRSLAAKLSDDPIRSKDDAETAIREELEQRGAS